MDVAARAVEAISIVQPHWIAGLGELLHAHAALEFPEQAMTVEDVAQAGANPFARALHDSSAPRGWTRHVLAVQLVEFVVEILDQQRPRRAELQNIRECLIENFTT